MISLAGGLRRRQRISFKAAAAAASGPAFRAASSTTTTSSTMTCAMPTGVAAGDILVMTVWFFFDPKSGTVPSLPSGWTQRAVDGSNSGDGYRFYVFTKTAGASESSVTQTGTNWYSGSMTIAAISGGSAVDVVGTLGYNTLVAPSVTTTTTNGLLVGTWVVASVAAERTITLPGTMTSQITTGVSNTWKLTSNVGTQTLTALGATGTRTATATAGSYQFSHLLAVK